MPTLNGASLDLTAAYDAIKDACVAVVNDLELPGLAGGVQRMLVADDTVNVALPCVVVTSEGEQERLTGGDTLLKEVEFPVRVFVLDRAQLKGASKDLDAKYTGWRGAIIDAFQQERLAGLVGVTCMIDPRVIYDPKQPEYQFVVSGFVARFTAWFPRKSKAAIVAQFS
jgi:hypothetical protein